MIDKRLGQGLFSTVLVKQKLTKDYDLIVNFTLGKFFPKVRSVHQELITKNKV